MEETRWGRLVFAFRTRLRHALWLSRNRYSSLPIFPPTLPRSQELLGHSNLTTFLIYTRVPNRGGHGVRSPVHRL
jgi:hypothetical protein